MPDSSSHFQVVPHPFITNLASLGSSVGKIKGNHPRLIASILRCGLNWHKLSNIYFMNEDYSVKVLFITINIYWEWPAISTLLCLQFENLSI